MKLKNVIILISILVSSGLIPVYAQDLYQLVYKPVKGNTHYYITRTNLKFRSEAGDKETNLDQKLVFKLKLDITDVLQNRFYLRTTIDSCFITSTNPHGGKDIINRGEGVVGTRNNMNYSVYGANAERKGKKNITEMTSSMADAFIVEFPERLIVKGDKWSIVDTMYIPFGRYFKIPFTLVTETRFAGIETIDGRECIKLKITREVDLDETTEIDDHKVDIELALDSDEIYYFDYKLGMTRRVEGTNNLYFKGNEPDTGIKIVLDIKTKSEISLVNR